MLTYSSPVIQHVYSPGHDTQSQMLLTRTTEDGDSDGMSLHQQFSLISHEARV